MRKRIVLFLIVIIYTSVLYGQNLSSTKIAQDSLSTLQQLALNYARQGDYSQAIKIQQKVVNYFREINISQDLILNLNNLAAFYSDSGEYEKAIEIGEQIMVLMNDSIELDNDRKCDIFRHQAIFYENIGNHEKSLEYGELALVIAKELPIETLEYPRCLTILAFVNSELGDYDSAIKLSGEAKDIYETMKNKPDEYGYLYNDLGAYYCEQGDINKALDYGWDYANYLRENNASDTQRMVVALNNLARYYAINKNSEKAIELSFQALSIIENNHIENKFLKGRTYENLSVYYANVDDYTKSLKYSEKAIAYYRNIWSYKRPGMLNLFRKHLQYSLKTSNICNQETQIIETSSNISNLILGTFAYLPNSGRKLYWVKYSSWYENELPVYAYVLRTDSLISTTYNSLLLSKGILLHSEISFFEHIAECGDQNVMDLYHNLQSNRTVITKLYDIPIAERPIDVDSLEDRTMELEKELMIQSKFYGDYTHNLFIDWEQVQSSLKDDDIAIEFVSFPIKRDSVIYCALTLKKGYDSPRMIELFEAKQLSKIAPHGYYTSKAVSNLVWKPLNEELANVKNIYFAPAGELYNIAIESIKDYEGDGYVFDKWHFCRLSSTRELVLKRTEKNVPNAALYGGIKYDATNFKFEKDTTLENNIYRMVARSLPDSLGTRASYEYLPGTLKEVQYIDSLYTVHNIPTQLYSDKANIGSETSLKKLSGTKLSSLHISTHGFYWSDSEVNSNKDLIHLNFIQRSNNSRYIEDKSMTRSGLLFAGANAALQGDSIPEWCDDGILTAQEISTLDFRGLDLLVLSACQTGLGEIKGDGVFGLQRGFKKAGVQSIVMSLWKVDDDATQMLMTAFYENLLAGKSKRESLLNAQKVVRETPGFENPKYWAGFILLDALNKT